MPLDRSEDLARQLAGFRYLKQFGHLFASLHDCGTQDDKAGNRDLFFDQYASLILRLLRSLRLPHLDSVPERFAFSLRDLLGRRSDGPSMHVAGLLAVVREANGRPPLFGRACSVVQLDADRLVPVGGGRQKLDAFRRECGDGTLLVRCPNSEASEFDAHFEVVWKVDSLAALAQGLERQGLLRVLLAGHLLSSEDAKTVAARVHQLEVGEHRYSDALNLS